MTTIAKKKTQVPAQIAVQKSDEQRVLYTIRLEPSIIAKLHDMAKKLGTTHAAIARGILQEGV